MMPTVDESDLDVQQCDPGKMRSIDDCSAFTNTSSKEIREPKHSRPPCKVNGKTHQDTTHATLFQHRSGHDSNTDQATLLLL